ncbi:MAG TPA: carbonic anhydrase [Frankiaceae bacterium]|nr:carbonic anhydrase [Frankiaceae bacterium]
MTAIDHLLERSRTNPSRFPGMLAAPPSMQVAIVTCMDARIDVYDIFGQASGQAHVIGNAGGVVTDDVVRSLAISQRALGTRGILLMQHTECRLVGFDGTGFRAQIESETGERPAWSEHSLTGQEDASSPRSPSCAATGCWRTPTRSAPPSTTSTPARSARSRDTLGLTAVDEVLASAASRRGGPARTRSWGDELAIVLPADASEPFKLRLGDRRRPRAPFALPAGDGHEVRIGASCRDRRTRAAGSARPPDGQRDVLRDADIAMFAAKPPDAPGGAPQIR